MTDLTGWLLDAYAAPGEGAVLWLAAGEERIRLRMRFPVTFYAAGAAPRLRALWQWLENQAERPQLSRVERPELFRPVPLTVLAAWVDEPAAQVGLFYRAADAFPDLHFFDADIPVGLRLAACFGIFPLARVRLQADAGGWVQALEALDSPWDLDPEPPPLRIMRLAPDRDPNREAPAELHVQTGRRFYRFSLQSERALLVNLRALLERDDPDLLLTEWGDGWLLPHLRELSARHALPLPLNRDETMPIIERDERSYFAYGQVIHRGRQTLLSGRWHIDQYNAMMFHDYGLAGILESARVTATPVQRAARLSPGSGISAMQMVTALRRGVLIPWHKQQTEAFKSGRELVRADQGGLVYQPLLGLHCNVAEIDFISMYPGIMAYFNVSPETVGVETPGAQRIPQLELWVDTRSPGLVPETLRPLLEKRVALKMRAAERPAWDPRRALDKARAAAHKWLLVTCFGYLGYKNARFGRIEAHQAVTAYSRECLLRAKEAAEEAGYQALHLYVDGLWIAAEPGGAAFRTPGDVQPLLDEIARRTSLPISLEGIYRWVVFLPSRLNDRISVANRYFGVFQDGEIKVRGIEARRRDTCPFIARVQMTTLELLARAPSAARLPDVLPEVEAYLRREWQRLRRLDLPLPDLLITQKVSREPAQYRVPSPAARAAAQLAAHGKTTRPGQAVRFLYVRGRSGVLAWDCPPHPRPEQIDIAYYGELFRRACLTVLQPFGVTPLGLRRCLEERAAQTLTEPAWRLPGV